MLKKSKWSLVYVVLIGVLLGPLGCGKLDPEQTQDIKKNSAIAGAKATPKLLAVNIEKLQDRAGVIYIVNGQEPFTGITQDFYNNGQMRWEFKIENGNPTSLKRWHRNGILELSCRFSAGKLGDISTKAFELISEEVNAKRLDGEFSAFQEDGVQTIAGSFVRGRPVGLLTAWSQKGWWIMATYENGSPVQVEHFDNKGQLIAKVGFSRAKYGAAFWDFSSHIGSPVEVFHGECVSYHPNGQKAIQCTYKNGEIDGEYVKYHSNGKKDLQCTYKNGEIDGEYVKYHSNGQKDLQCTYKNGEIDGEYVKYHSNGKKDLQCTYKNGEIDGEYVSYHTNGQMAIQCTYKNGEIDGEYVKYHSNGKKDFQCTYKNGEIIGDLQLWALDGSKLTSMVLIPAGTNSGTDPHFGAYSLKVDSFYMDKCEVIKAQWDEVYTWAVANGYSFDNAGSGKAANHPVHTVSWYDCVKWCNARSEKEGRMPCYTVSGSVYKTGQSAPDCNFSANGYRLPTDVEWEYAARGGVANQRFPWGDTITHSQANYESSSSYAYDTSPTRGYHPTYKTGSKPYTSPVGSFAANGYGLYDMAGNLWEWCNDTSGSNRGIRGGSWYDGAYGARCGYSSWYDPGYADYDIGFRSVCR